jgi:uncharacterized membrane protein YdjX (TVP38/TMEM64 family)
MRRDHTKKMKEFILAKASRFCVLWRKSLTQSMFGVSQFLFDVGPSLATCQVERLRRYAAPRQALGSELIERASDGSTGTKQAITQNWDAPLDVRRCPPALTGANWPAHLGGLMEKASSPWKMIAVVIVFVAMAMAGFWWLKIHDFSVRLAIDEGITVLRSAGPWVFFVAMALLPAVGFPISVFYLTAASAFAAQMGMVGVIVAAGAAIAVDLALSYWLARYGLRPWLEQMIGRTKYKIPVVAEADQTQIILLVRITPGPPFFVQNFLLGLAGVRFAPYFWISWTVNILYASGFIVFGEAILHGKGKAAFVGLSVLLALGMIIHLLRRHYGKKGN